MNGFWTGAGAAQQVAIAIGSAWSGLHFARRMQTGTRARRTAAALLALLFFAIAAEAIAGVHIGPTAVEVLRRIPLLLATTGIAFLVTYRPRDARTRRVGIGDEGAR